MWWFSSSELWRGLDKVQAQSHCEIFLRHFCCGVILFSQRRVRKFYLLAALLLGCAVNVDVQLIFQFFA